MIDNARSTALESAGFARELDGEHLRLLEEVASVEEVEPGEVVVREDEPGDALNLIVEGQVEILKSDREGEHTFPLATLGEGEFFGEITFVGDGPTTARVEGRESTILVRIPRDRLMEREGGREVFYRLSTHIAEEMGSRLRHTDSSLTESRRSELELARERSRFGQFMAVMVTIFCIITLSLTVYGRYAETPVQEVFSTWGLALGGLIPITIYVQFSSLPPSSFGFNLKNWFTQLKETALVTGGVVAVLLAGAFFGKPGSPLFSFDTMRSYPAVLFYTYLGLYPIHSFFQELVLRGVVQGSLERFMDEYHAIVPVGILAFLFGTVHLHFSLSFAVLTFLVSFIFGMLYSRHESLLGVTIIHAVGGITAMAVGLF